MPGRTFLSREEFENFIRILNRRLYKLETGVSGYSGTVEAHATEHEDGGSDLLQHDNLYDFVSNEHIDHSGVDITAGTGLTGGGDITATRTLNVSGVLADLNTLGAAASDGEIIVATGAGAFAYESGATARASLGLTIGTDVQAWDYDLDDIAALAHSANGFIVSDGTDWVAKTLAETGAILEADINHGNIQGLGTGADHSYIDQDVTSGSSPTFGDITVGDGNWIGNGAAAPRIVFDDTNNDIALMGGNVGIGTTEPGVNLHVNGSWVADYGIISVDGDAGGLSGIGLLEDGTYKAGLFYRGADDVLSLYTQSAEAIRFEIGGNNEKMRIDTNGNVGIGTVTPGAKVEIEVADTDTCKGLLIDFNETGSYHALEIDSESTAYAAAQINGKYTLRLTPDISNGYAIEAKRNIDEAGNNPLVNIIDDHTSNTQTTLRVQQDGSGDILNLFDGSTEVFTVLDGGSVGIGLTPTANMDGLSIEAGLLTLKETTTPTADANYGKIYTKSDNKLYCQTGDGVEHEIAFV